MKKLIIILLAILVISSTSLVSANGTDHKNSKMKTQIMQMQNNFMDRLKKEVNKETAKKLDDMIKSHRSEMKKMMKMAKKMKPTEEQQKQKRIEMKKRHFENLKNILINYPSVYEKYSKEMEEIMAKIMKMRQKIKMIDEDSDDDGLSDGDEILRAIREGGRTVGAGQFMKNKGKNNTHNKADLKELAEQLVNLSIKFRNSNSEEDKKIILSRIIIIVRKLKQYYSIERIFMKGLNGNLEINKSKKIIINKGNLILKRINRLPKMQKKVFYNNILLKLKETNLKKINIKSKMYNKVMLLYYLKSNLEK